LFKQAIKLNAEILKHAADLVNILSTTECLAYQNTTWNEAIDWFTKTIVTRNVDTSINNKELITRFVDIELNEL
jgi:hypothetical protein